MLQKGFVIKANPIENMFHEFHTSIIKNYYILYNPIFLMYRTRTFKQLKQNLIISKYSKSITKQTTNRTMNMPTATNCFTTLSVVSTLWAGVVV